MNLPPQALTVLASLKERLLSQSTDLKSIPESIRTEKPRRSHVMRRARVKGSSCQHWLRQMARSVSR